MLRSALAVVVTWALGCTAPAGQRAAGESCLRAAECQPGLVCNGGVCTNNANFDGGEAVSYVDGSEGGEIVDALAEALDMAIEPPDDVAPEPALDTAVEPPDDAMSEPD